MSVPHPATPYTDQRSSILPLLDDLTTRLTHAPEASTMREAVQQLDVFRRELPIEDWREVARTLVQNHPLTKLLLQDPFTERAWRKPRGYPGDAVMLDYVYDGLGANYVHEQSVSPFGRILFEQTVGSPTGEAARNRKQILADYVDATAEQVDKPVMLAIACGHLREAALSTAYKQGRIGSWYALDQDAESLASVKAFYGEVSGIIPIKASIGDIIKERIDLPQADFVYAAGLYDYLDQPSAASLLKALYARVKPMGRLLIANYVTDSAERGYMESVMDWWLIYRSEDDMMQLTNELADPHTSRIKVYRDQCDRIIYLDVQRLS